MKNNHILTEQQSKAIKDYLKSEEGKKKIAEVFKPKNKIDEIVSKQKEMIWWNNIKDIPFTI